LSNIDIALKVPADHDSRSNYVKLFVGSVPRTATEEDVSITSMLLSSLLAYYFFYVLLASLFFKHYFSLPDIILFVLMYDVVLPLCITVHKTN